MRCLKKKDQIGFGNRQHIGGPGTEHHGDLKSTSAEEQYKT